MNSLSVDFKRNILFLLILFIGAIPQILAGYSNYLWILLLPLCLIGHTFILNGTVILIALFGICYVVPLFAHDNCPPASIIIFHLLYPLTMYEVGIYLCKRCRNPYSVLFFFVLTIFCFASWSIMVNFDDYLKTGEFVNAMRTIYNNSGEFLKATHHNSMLAMGIGGMGCIFLHPISKIEKKLRITVIAIAILSLMATLHLLNRTGVVLAVASLLIGFFWNGLTTKRLVQTLLILLLLGGIYFVFIDGSQLAESIQQGFSDREEYDEDTGASFGGGRGGRWITGMLTIISNPLGTEGILYLNNKTQAHNFWLDIGVDSGWVAFGLILILTILFITTLKKFLKKKSVPRFVKGYITMVVSTLFLQFAVEPIMESVFQVAFMWFFLWGLLSCNLSFNSEKLNIPSNKLQIINNDI